MPTLEDLVVGIAADVQRATRNMDRFERDFAKVTNQVQRNNRRIESNFQRMQRNITRSIRGVLPVLSGAALVQGARRAIDYADSIGVAADRLGVGVEFLQEFRFAAEDSSNVLARQADTALQRFTRRVGEAAQGGGELLGVLEQYDIEVRNADGSTRAITDVLADYADAVAGAESSQEQLRLAFKAFDSEGAALVNLLREGSDGFERYAAAARDAGILTTDQVRQAQELDSQLTRLSQTLNTELTRAFVDAGPAISGFVTLMAAVARGLGAVARNTAETLRLFGLIDGIGIAPDIAQLQAVVNEINTTGSLSLVNPDREAGYASLLEREGALARLRERPGFGERLIQAEAANDIQGVAAVVQEYIDARNQLGDLAVNLADPTAGGGGGGSDPFNAGRAIAAQTEALRLRTAALLELTPAEQRYAEVIGEVNRQFVEAGGVLTPENLEFNRDVVEIFLQAEQQFNDTAQAVDLVQRAIGDLQPSAEVASLATDLLAQEIERLGLDAEAAAEATANLERELSGDLKQGLIDFDQLGQAAGQSIASAFGDAILRGEELSDVLVGLAQDLANIALQQAVLAPLGSELGGLLGGLFGGGSGGGGGATQSASVGVGHTGGIAGHLPSSRMVDGAVFANAPRYHMGGLAGVLPGEVPAILKRGEGVFTPQQMQALGPRGDTVVQIVDNRTGGSGDEGLQVSEQRIGDNRLIKVTIRDEVRGGVRSGDFDAPMRERFGIVPTRPGR